MISDLLPLYQDGICSQASKKVIEEHLAECPDCRNLLGKMGDTTIDEKIIKEKNEIIKTQSKVFKRKSALAGAIVGAVFTLPILICLIVDLATGSGLSWFFIVLAAMFIPTSLFVVPLLANKNKMFLTMSSFTASVILLLGVICIYSGGDWFLVAASATLFGLTVLFAPFIAFRNPVTEYLKDSKGLAILGAYTVTFFLMMACIGFYTGPAEFFPLAMAINLPLVSIVWAFFAIIRYLPFNKVFKTGACIAAFSGLVWMQDGLIASAEAHKVSMTGVYYYSSPMPVLGIIGLAVGAVLIIIGLLIRSKGEKKNEIK